MLVPHKHNMEVSEKMVKSMLLINNIGPADGERKALVQCSNPAAAFTGLAE